jgi:hypothetical protein
MIAGFLSKPSNDEIDMAKSKHHNKGLNPIVAKTLANEPIEVQRGIIGILSILKILARNIAH